MDSLVSIIIPCFNAATYINRALNSIREQDYKEIEVICVDDGSSDGTLEQIEKYHALNDLNIKLIKQENLGVSSARNTGIRNSSGKFILFLDSDDIYSSNYVSSLVSSIGDSGTAFCYWTTDISKISNNQTLPQHYTQDEIMRAFIYRKVPISFLNFLYIREIINTYKIRFDEDLKYGEDNLFFWKYLVHIKDGFFIREPMYWYCQHDSSAQHNVKWNRIDAIRAIDRAGEYLNCEKCPFYVEFKDYIPYRTRFTVLLDFARGGKRELFNKFYEEYDIKDCTNYLINRNGFLLTLSCICAKYARNMFYFIINYQYRINKYLQVLKDK